MASSGPVVGSDVILFQDGDLSELHLAIPRRWGIPPATVQLRCVAASRELVILGTNVGMIIVHQLQDGTTEKVPLEGPLKRTAVTSVQLFADLHNRLAIGRQSGLINILQVVTDEKERKCSSLRKLHKVDVTCVQWDTRGSMLFSGDSSGKVMASKIDMKEGKHQSWLVYDCNASIVQLSFSSMMLLVSSELRSVMCHVYPDVTLDSPPRVGSKERKPGAFGGCLVTENSETTCYVARPGVRVWQADKSGKVLATMKLKESLDSSPPTIKLPGKRKEDESSVSADVQFGQLQLFSRRFLVSWFAGHLWLLDRHCAVLAGITAGVGNILDVCVCQRWLYVLREPPYAHQLSVVRLALDPSVVPRGEQSPTLQSLFAEARTTSALAVQAGTLSAASSASTIADYDITRGLSPTGDDFFNKDSLVRTASPAPPPKDVSDNKVSTEKVVSPPASISLTGPDFGHHKVSDAESLHHADIPSGKIVPALSASAPSITLSEVSDKTCETDIPLLDEQEGRSMSTKRENSEAASGTSSREATSGSLSREAARSTSSREGTSGSLSREAATGSSSKEAASGLSSCEAASGSSSRESASGSSSREAASGSSSREAASGSSSREAASGSSSREAARDALSQEVARGTSLRSSAAEHSEPVNQPRPASSLAMAGQGAEQVSECLKGILRSTSQEEDTLLVKPKRAPKKKKKGTGQADGSVGKTSFGRDSGANIPDSVLLNNGQGTPSPIPSPRANSPLTGLVSGPDPTATDASSAEVSRGAIVASTEQSHCQVIPSPPDVHQANVLPDDAQVAELARRVSPCVDTSSLSCEDSRRERMTTSEKELQGDSDTDRNLPVDLSVTCVEVTAGESHSEVGKEEDDHADRQLAEQINPNTSPSVLGDLQRDQQHALSVNVTRDSGSHSVVSALTDDDEPSGSFGSNDNSLAAEEHQLAARISSDEDGVHSMPEATADVAMRSPTDTDVDAHVKSIYDMASSTSSLTELTLQEPTAGQHQQHEVYMPTQPSAARMSVSNPDRLMDSWAEWLPLGRHALASVASSPSIVGISCSKSHVWVVDSKDNVFVSSLSTHAWQPVRGKMRQVSSSPSGEVVWAFSKSGSLYYRFGINPKQPYGTDWKKMDVKVKAIAADNRRCWVINPEGYLVLRRTVSGACPTGQSWVKLDLRPDFQSIAAGYDVLWAVTSGGQLFARLGISRHSPSGMGWESVSTGKVQSVSLGRKNYGWCISDGVASFMSNVSMKTPSGDERWWQVAMGQLLHGSTFMTSLLSWPFAKRSDSLMLVCACESIVFTISSASVIRSCSGSMEGSLYRSASPLGTTHSMTWICVAANAIYEADSRIWALRPNGELFCFQRGKRADAVDLPSGRHQLQWLSVSSDSVWALSTQGLVFERAGLSRYCPLGTKWQNVSVETLGGAKVVDIACGLYWVWAVDDKGFVWLRHGPLAVSKSGWQRIEPFSWTVRFAKIIIGADWLVWALDSNGGAYARMNITAECPTGTVWEHIPGLSCTELSIGSNTGIGNNTIWGISSNGDVVSRNNVTPRNPVGDYWKRVPGSFVHISATPDNELWVIDQSGALFVRETSMYHGPQVQGNDAELEGWDIL